MSGPAVDSIRTFRIAAVLPMEAEYASRLMEGAIAYAEETAGVELLQRAYVRGKLNPLPREKPDFDAALVFLRPDEDWVSRLIAAGVMVVNASGDRRSEEVPNVAFCGDDVTRKAVEHLASLGRRQAAYIGGAIEASPSFSRRVQRFSAQCREHGMAVDVLPLGRFAGIEDCATLLRPNQRRQLDAFLLSLTRPAVILCDDDQLARHVCDVALETGLRVPEDLAVLGVGDYRVARLRQPTISSIAQPGQDVGRRAMQWIHENLRAGTRCTGTLILPVPCVKIRASTRPTHGDDQVYRQAMAWITERACERVTVTTLMETLTVSQRTFSRRFAEIYGRTPGAEIRRIRMERAKAYLETTTLPLEKIAPLCGFETPKKFSKFFKRETGRTPSAHRLGPRRPRKAR